MWQLKSKVHVRVKKREGGGGRRTLNPRGACALRAIPIVRLVSSNGIFM